MCLHWLRSCAHHSWNSGLGLVCHSVVWMHPFPLSARSLYLLALITFPQSDPGSAIGSPRGWEIPTTRSLYMTLDYKTTQLPRVVHHENRDHLVTKTEEARPKTRHSALSLCDALSPSQEEGGGDN